MRRWMHANSYAHGEPDALQRLLLDQHVWLLARATGTRSPAMAPDGSFELRLRAAVWTWELATQIRVTVGVAARAGQRVALPLSWVAVPARGAYPRFDGALELEPVSSIASLLTLTGVYEPPLGAVGAAIDTTLLRDRADDTAWHLVRRLSQELSAAADDGQPPGAPPPAGPTDAPRARVRDVMTSDVTTVAASASLRTAAAMLFTEGISGAPVVGDDGALVGVVSEHDLLAKQSPPVSGVGHLAIEHRRRHNVQNVAAACSSPALVVAPDAPLRDAARMMLEHNVARLVVTEHGAIAGIVSRHDVLAALLHADDLVAATIDRVLRDRDETAVTATVVDGAVVLKGAVQMRSVAAALPRIVSELDGVVSVETNLRWDTDDTTPIAPRR